MAQKQTIASGIAAVAPITALSRALTAALDPDALAPIAPDFPPERAQEIARAVRNDTVAALCRALDTALRETVGGWDTGAAARALHAAGAFAATLPAADAELDARRGRVLRRLVRVQEDTLSRVAADLTRALADAPPGATFVGELFFAVASATNDALLTNDPAAIAPALAAAEAACAAFSRALRQRQLPAVHFLNEAGRFDACLTRDLSGTAGSLAVLRGADPGAAVPDVGAFDVLRAEVRETAGDAVRALVGGFGEAAKGVAEHATGPRSFTSHPPLTVARRAATTHPRSTSSPSSPTPSSAFCPMSPGTLPLSCLTSPSSSCTGRLPTGAAAVTA